MKRIYYTLILVFIFYQIILPQNKTEFDNKSESTRKDINLSVWDIQFTGNITEATGAEFDGLNFYVTHSLSNLIKKYDISGTLIETFSIPGISGLGDLAFDGTYMYGGNGSPVIYQMDFVNQVLVNSFPSPVNVRHIAYDEVNDGFWVGGWFDPIALILRNGTLIVMYNLNLPFITGSAYDNYNPNGPYLWLFGRNQIPGPQLIHQFSILTGTFTGVTHDVLSDVGATQPNALAGGLFSTTDFISGSFSIGGVLIGNPSILFLYDVTYPIPVELTYFAAKIDNDRIILNWQTATETNNEGFDILRSIENRKWETIAFIPGFGTTTEPKRYIYSDKVLASGIYSYRLKQIDYDGTYEYSKVIEIEVKTPVEYSLEQNYPNPFNPTTTIKYQIPELSFFTLKVYDVLGREIATLINEEKPAGNYEVEFSAIGGSASGGDTYNLPSGVYFYRLKAVPTGRQAGDFFETKKMVLMK